jgi:tRNA(Ile2) C34 agmatinyltransferase TiaS
MLETSPALRAPVCPRCQSALGQHVRCQNCGATYAVGPYPGTLSLGELEANFAQRLDADVF